MKFGLHQGDLLDSSLLRSIEASTHPYTTMRDLEQSRFWLANAWAEPSSDVWTKRIRLYIYRIGSIIVLIGSTTVRIGSTSFASVRSSVVKIRPFLQPDFSSKIRPPTGRSRIAMSLDTWTNQHSVATPSAQTMHRQPRQPIQPCGRKREREIKVIWPTR